MKLKVKKSIFKKRNLRTYKLSVSVVCVTKPPKKAPKLQPLHSGGEAEGEEIIFMVRG
jgi:hypothetical protein